MQGSQMKRIEVNTLSLSTKGLSVHLIGDEIHKMIKKGIEEGHKSFTTENIDHDLRGMQVVPVNGGLVAWFVWEEKT